MSSQVKIRNSQLTFNTNYNQPWFIFILVYLSCYCYLVSSVHSKDRFSSHQKHLNQPSFASFIESINASISNKNNNHHQKNTSNFKNVHNDQITFPINNHCLVDKTLRKVLCQGLRGKKDLPERKPYFLTVEYAEFVNVSTHTNDIDLEDLHALFPNVVHLSINHSPESLLSIIAPKNEFVMSLALVMSPNETIGLFDGQEPQLKETLRISKRSYDIEDLNNNYVENVKFIWDTVKYLNLSWNELTSDVISHSLLDTFPNLEVLDVSHNFVAELNIDVKRLTKLKSMDISGNPLDCSSSDFYWLEEDNIELLHPDQTLCDQPPHQNKAKPIRKVIRLIKKVREECRVNCTCDIAYIWEQNHVIHSKNSVNCSNKGFTEFPDPDKLPHPTDTLDLSNNQITSMQKFVEVDRYTDLHVMNLYLDNNQISSIDMLEGSEWFYNFQVFTVRNNSIAEVPVYVLENVFRQNKRILHIDLSMNPFHCECVTFSTLKIWLLRYSSNIIHIDDVRCEQTGEQIRYLKREDWCKLESGEALIDILDVLSIFLLLIIFLVIGKVYYDYWNFKTNGKLPWLVRKM